MKMNYLRATSETGRGGAASGDQNAADLPCRLVQPCLATASWTAPALWRFCLLLGSGNRSLQIEPMNPLRHAMLLPRQLEEGRGEGPGPHSSFLIHNLTQPPAPHACKSHFVIRKCETPETFHLCFTLFRETFHLPTPCSSRPSQTVSGCSAIFRHRFLSPLTPAILGVVVVLPSHFLLHNSAFIILNSVTPSLHHSITPLPHSSFLIHNLTQPTAPQARKSHIVNRKCETPETFHCFTMFRETFHLLTPCSSRPSRLVPPHSAIFRHRFLFCYLTPSPNYSSVPSPLDRRA